MTVLVYVNNGNEVGDVDHLKVLPAPTSTKILIWHARGTTCWLGF